jgi:hypothetical protein
MQLSFSEEDDGVAATNGQLLATLLLLLMKKTCVSALAASAVPSLTAILVSTGRVYK